VVNVIKFGKNMKIRSIKRSIVITAAKKTHPRLINRYVMIVINNIKKKLLLKITRIVYEKNPESDDLRPEYESYIVLTHKEAA